MTLSESEIRVFALPKVIKERSIGGEDTVAFQQRRRKKCERENIGKEDGRALTQEDNPKLLRRETRDIGGSTQYQQPQHRTATGRITRSCLGNRDISQVFLVDFWVFRFFHLWHK